MIIKRIEQIAKMSNLIECSKCHMEKDWEKEFYHHVDGGNVCKACKNERTRNYRLKIKDETYKMKRRDLGDASEGCKICSKCYTEKTLESFYYDKSRQCHRQPCKECKNNHDISRRKGVQKEKIETPDNLTRSFKEYMEETLPRRRENKKIYVANNPKIKEGTRISRKIRDILIGKSKGNEYILNILQCDADFFLEWMKFQFYDNMTWENYGEWWHIDHCVPYNEFDLDNIEESSRWYNLRPLRAVKNNIKHKKIDKFAIVMQEIKASAFEKLYYQKSTNTNSCGKLHEGFSQLLKEASLVEDDINYKKSKVTKTSETTETTGGSVIKVTKVTKVTETEEYSIPKRKRRIIVNRLSPKKVEVKS